jgi:hypothetical protein
MMTPKERLEKLVKVTERIVKVAQPERRQSGNESKSQ